MIVSVLSGRSNPVGLQLCSLCTGGVRAVTATEMSMTGPVVVRRAALDRPKNAAESKLE